MSIVITAEDCILSTANNYLKDLPLGVSPDFLFITKSTQRSIFYWFSKDWSLL